MSDYVNISIKLHKEKDRDLINFLEGKPKSWFVKESLRAYKDLSNVDASKIKEMVKEQPQVKEETDAANILRKMNFGG